MKVFIFIILTTLSFKLHAQTYTPLLDQHNEWHLTTCFGGCITDIYHAMDDTTANGYTYKILDGFHYISRTFLLRENTNEKKVYLAIVEPTKINEYLLYDFSLNEGDSIEMKNPTSPFPASGGYYYVDSIRLHTLVDGNDYKHLYFSPSPFNLSSNESPVWVEGVGSLSMINAPGGTPSYTGAGEVSCFFKYGELFYQNLDSVNECSTELLDVENTNKKVKLKIKTIAPFKKYELNAPYTIESFSIHNSQGQLIDQYSGINKSKTAIDLSAFPSGMYFIRLSDIKQHYFSIKLLNKYY